ncbi:phosphopentomutase [Paenibacillus sambharensis]|uniref:Phosphopentomutase n=1 Tax=Paenibacillus sambharensis TaxID=1803190 RepID=A0A2W1LEK6_9BACL|nr:phosphopentomutase [Paenibacillus sambharensis]PZD93465.1 phosphopentomutase [Paenibacillus sambharensis]
MQFKRMTVIVLDSVGIGELPDAPSFGDAGAHTLGHIAEQVSGFDLPNLRKLGLGNIAPIGDWNPAAEPLAAYGRMAEVSVGKDTMTGHWELAGLRINVPFRTFPDGFPAELLSIFEERTGRKVIGNKPASGTEILDELGRRQMETGEWIVYTSADSVFQIAAHEEIIPLEELYRACEIARELTLEEPYAVGRVIARPYVGEPGSFKRTSNRHDYAVSPPSPTVLNALQDGGFDVWSVGKINDIFSGEGITASYPTKSNADGIERTIELMDKSFSGLLFTNLVDFDSLFGHRRDPAGYAGALKEFDQELPRLLERVTEDDLLIITADHGNDPVHAGTDHTREYVPLLAYNPRLKNVRLGVRETFSDVAATIAANFGVAGTGNGRSFLSELTNPS